MRKAKVYFKGTPAGILAEDKNGFVFRYEDDYFLHSTFRPISMTMPKSQQVYHHPTLFPVFFNMLPEGANKATLCRLLKIDQNDFFGLLLATAQYDTIGAITVIPIYE
ncbi:MULTISPECIES: HipA N-terminal domain-containing protein [unclassified Arcicella]|uniref:HipA N-terminal domain-containing protein n=1 Tax=unclassified Arcicella TaxID=2644986 RepID=UPI0028608EF8|nr:MULTISPECIES: HipA N-terminal domain-containing protein [unclassified Arcicella]MDR6562148.1 serine/threonine-protein kinase HipA [Arcicella sp. BE51]MDR6812157.1 serine/threonine-protein kinase HipA [Arcicella sp. BE140]MDR6823469.1 serine/threonine-protein kinase HipA [Arcicella sp. BE139]